MQPSWPSPSHWYLFFNLYLLFFSCYFSILIKGITTSRKWAPPWVIKSLLSKLWVFLHIAQLSWTNKLGFIVAFSLTKLFKYSARIPGVQSFVNGHLSTLCSVFLFVAVRPAHRNLCSYLFAKIYYIFLILFF